MTVTPEENVRQQAVARVAEHMLIAARTAPKARGIDHLAIAVADRDGIRQISVTLKEIAKRRESPGSLLRDAENILSAEWMVIMGARIRSIGLRSCTLCGYPSCEEKDKHPEIPCVFNTTDLGIALGSAVSVAMEARVDNRIMYTVGQAVLALGLLGPDVKIALGIPLSVSAKNPFFDRK